MGEKLADPHTEELNLRVPKAWKDRMRELAAEQAISMNAVGCILLRAALYPERKEDAA
jgi:hypothetical protein